MTSSQQFNDGSNDESNNVIEDVIIKVSKPDCAEKAHKTRSEVWKFYERKNTSVECKLCHSSLAYHGGTSLMKEHLKRKHPANSPFSAENGYKQRKLDAFAKNRPCSSERTSAISKQILVMIVRD